MRPTQTGKLNHFVIFYSRVQKRSMKSSSCLLFGIKVWIVLIFAGWVCLWVLKPTQIWKKSWHVVDIRADKSFLGRNGLNVVVFSYPVLLIALLGYLYLHLLSLMRRERSQRRAYSIINISNPIIIGKPVGIISTGEFSSAVFFAAILVWTMYSTISNDFIKMKPFKPLHLIRLEIKIMHVGIRFGSISEICMAVLFIPVLRGMSVLKIFGLEFEGCVRYHVWLGTATVVFSTVHGMMIMFVWGIKRTLWSEMTSWRPKDEKSNLAGVLTLLIGLIVSITSISPIRRKHFEFFYSFHHLYIIYIVFFMFHVGDRYFHFVISGILLLALDKIMRVTQSRPPPTRLGSATLLPCRAIMLTLSKHPSIKYGPTSLIFLNIATISKLQWHPFSIVSSSNINHDNISVIIKCQGWWTTTLHNQIQSILQTSSSSSSSNHVNPDSISINSLPVVSFEGPYGPCDDHLFQKYDRLILVAGGSGITPYLSFIAEACGRNRYSCSRNSKKREIQLIYTVKTSSDLSMLMPISSLLLNESPSSTSHFLHLRAFVTREERNQRRTLGEILEEFSEQVQTVVQNSPPSTTPDDDRQTQRTNVPNMFSCSGSKMVMTGLCASVFLVSSVLLTPQSIPVFGSFLIAVCCSWMAAVAIRNGKRGNGDVVKSHVGNVVQKKAVFVNESLSVSDRHEVSFGRRPVLSDFADLVKFEGEGGGGDEVGVFVCGPDSMQETVAAICRKHGRRSANKCSFNFHSIKFSL